MLSILRYQNKIVEEMYIKGELTEKERNHTLNEIQDIEHRLEDHMNMNLEQYEKEIKNDKKIQYLFLDLHCLNIPDLAELEGRLISTKFHQDDTVYTSGEHKSQFVYLINHGLVNIGISNQSDLRVYGRNEILGLENVYHKENNFTTAIAQNPTSAYEVPIAYFKQLCEKYQELEAICKKEEIFYLLKTVKNQRANAKSSFFKQLSCIKSITLTTILKNSIMVKLKKD